MRDFSQKNASYVTFIINLTLFYVRCKLCTSAIFVVSDDPCTDTVGALLVLLVRSSQKLIAKYFTETVVRCIDDVCLIIVVVVVSFCLQLEMIGCLFSRHYDRREKK